MCFKHVASERPIGYRVNYVIRSSTVKAVLAAPVTGDERSAVFGFNADRRMELQLSIYRTDPILVRVNAVPALTPIDALDGLVGRPVLLDPAG